MGRGRRARQRRNRKKRVGTISQPATARRIEVELDGFEMAKGWDGPLRGAPEPCLLLGVFHVCDGRAVTVGRSLTRIRPPDRFPGRVEIRETLVRAAGFASSVDAAPRRFVLLAIAIEEDGGRDVQSIYADLDRPERFAIWDESAPIPEPRALAELGALPVSAAPEAESVRVMYGDSDLATTTKRDDFVGSLMIRLEASPVLRPDEWRFVFRSPDGLNDWTAIFLVRVR
jgi:hypothetical protein